MAARLTSSRFVGRAGQLAELELAWREVLACRSALVLLAGDSGVGKSRLIAEFARRHVESTPEGPAIMLRGEGVEQGEAELAYAPLLGALRPLARDAHPALDSLSAGSRAQLASLLPALDDGGARDGGTASSQLRLFEALLELIDLLSDAAPLLLVLEDMHWADRSTRTFVEFLARNLRDTRVMVLLSYRSDELHRRHPLLPLIAVLERLEPARRIELRPFDRRELREALTDILGREPDAAVVERLFSRSEGNPLYTEELLAAGLDGRGAAPQTLRDAFRLRVERLPPAAQQAARMTSVAGRLTQATLLSLCETPRDELQEALRQAVAEQVLVATDHGRLAFRHALLREIVYDDLLPGERSELHLALARMLEHGAAAEELSELERVAALAAHYAAAGEQRAALRATVEAARAARAAHADGEAAELLDRALELWARVPDAEAEVGADHGELLILAAEAHGTGGDRARAEVMLQRALGELGPDAAPARRAAVLARLARLQWGLNRGVEGIRTAQEALALLPEDGAGADVRTGLLAWLARTQVLRGRFREGVEDGERAREAAARAGHREVQSDVLNTLGMAQVGLGNVEEGVALLREALRVAQEQDDPDSAGSAYTNLADMLDLRGRTREALEVAREGLLQLPRYLALTQDWMNLTLSQLHFELGDWQAARAHLRAAGGGLVGRRLIFRLLREAESALGEGDDETALARLLEAEPLVAQSTEPQWIGMLGSLQGESYRRQGDLIQARAAVARALDRLEVCTDDVMRVVRLSAVGALVEAELAQRARDLRESADARQALARARIHLQRLRAAAGEGGPVEAAWLATAVAGAAAGRGRNDPRLWAKAVAAWEAIERPYPAALARWRAAEALVEAGEREAAAAQASAAATAARELGARWLVGEVEALGERGRLSLAAAPAEAGGNGASPEEAGDPFGLTPRERQVLALIAAGATNRQIGASLYMAEKTASVHVSRILGKLGVRSRTQAAAVAHRLHLA